MLLTATRESIWSVLFFPGPRDPDWPHRDWQLLPPAPEPVWHGGDHHLFVTEASPSVQLHVSLWKTWAVAQPPVFPVWWRPGSRPLQVAAGAVYMTERRGRKWGCSGHWKDIVTFKMFTDKYGIGSRKAMLVFISCINQPLEVGSSLRYYPLSVFPGWLEFEDLCVGDLISDVSTQATPRYRSHCPWV